MGTFLDPGSMTILMLHSDQRRRAREQRAAEIRTMVLAAIPETGTAPIWELTKALKDRATAAIADVLARKADLGRLEDR